MIKTTKRPKVFRMTPQRAAIQAFLAGNTGHPSAEDIHSRLKKRFPGMSLATVYNTLQALLTAGRLAEVKIDPTRRRFDPGLRRHAHLMCVACGLIADLPAGRQTPRGAPKGFKLLSCTVDFYGICPACGAAAAKEKRSCAMKK